MWGNKNKRAKAAIVDSVTERSVVIKGEVSFAGGYEARGTVIGQIRGEAPESVLLVSEGARVEGSIDVDRVIVEGSVEGPINARVSLVVRSTGSVRGDVTYGRLAIEDGAEVIGRLIPAAKESAPAQADAEPQAVEVVVLPQPEGQLAA